jgi:hypothetical protein
MRARLRVQYQWATLLTRGGPSQFRAAVYDGQDFLGIAYEDWDGKFRARTPDDEPVGPPSFKTMTEAMRAFSAVVRK